MHLKAIKNLVRAKVTQGKKTKLHVAAIIFKNKSQELAKCDDQPLFGHYVRQFSLNPLN